MCSFDIKNLFANVPLQETIEIFLDILYRDEEETRTTVPEKLFRKLLLKATTEVKFSFNMVLYAQVDGIAMGSLLGPTLANIFIGYLGTKIADSDFPLMYHQFVDGTFAIFEDNTRAVAFFDQLNRHHPNLEFTMESKKEKKMPFMNVKVKKMDDELQTAVY